MPYPKDLIKNAFNVLQEGIVHSFPIFFLFLPEKGDRINLPTGFFAS
jgi:hypothetical protein